MRTSTQIAYANLLVAIVVVAVKVVAWRLTSSIALYSDALESVLNVATAVAAILAIGIAARPADLEHPYGHHKAEYLSAVMVGVLIVVAALVILREAWMGYLDPRPLDAPWTGLAVSGVATVLNAAWSAVLLSRGKALRSAALAADGRHLATDVATSLGVLAGVSLVAVTGIAVLDAAVAGLVALHVLWSGWRLIRDSMNGLLDEAAPPQELSRIRETIARNSDGALEAHALRTRHAGPATFIDFHLVVPRAMSTGDAHDICDRVEAALRRELEGAVITIHVEPDHKAKHAGIPVL